MKKYVYIGLALTLVGLIAYGLRPQPVPVDVGRVTTGPMTVTVDEEGKTRIKERYTVVAPLTGQMKRIELKPGDKVEQGKTILTVVEPADPALLDARAVASAKARVNSAQAAKQQAGQMLEKAKVAVEFADTEYHRAKESYASRGTSEQILKEMEMLWRTKQLELKGANFAQRIADFELEQAEAALLQVNPSTSAANEPPRLTVPAPITGTVLKVLRESAGVVAAGERLIELGDSRDLEVVVEVLSRDAVAIHPGADVILEHWGGDQPLHGRVRRIEPAGFTKISALGVEEQRVNVLLDFVDPYEVRQTLGDGFRVEARIVTWSQPNVVRVPAGALFRQNGGWAVYKMENGIAKLQLITIGKLNALDGEVLKGLTDGDVVVLHPGDRVKDGIQIVVRE